MSVSSYMYNLWLSSLMWFEKIQGCVGKCGQRQGSLENIENCLLASYVCDLSMAKQKKNFAKSYVSNDRNRMNRIRTYR